MNVEKCMRTKVILASPDCTFERLLHKLASPVSRQIYIVDQERRLLGIITAMDLLREVIPSYMTADLARSFTDEADFLHKQVRKIKGRRAEEIMTRGFSFLSPHHQLLEAETLIAEKGINTLPIVDAKGKIVGELTRRDILLKLAEHCLDSKTHEDQLIDLSKPDAD